MNGLFSEGAKVFAANLDGPTDRAAAVIADAFKNFRRLIFLDGDVFIICSGINRKKSDIAMKYQ